VKDTLHVTILLLVVTLVSACSLLPWPSDPHVTEAGFFDMHVCNWPERPLFFKMVFSTTRSEQLQDVQIFAPDGAPLARFNLDQFKIVRRPGKPVKHVYLMDVDVPSGAQDGWYTAHIRTRDGRTHIARDHIVIRTMGQPGETVQPEDDSVQTVPPRELSWSPVPGARYYIVYVHDRWEDDRLIYESPRLTVPRLIIPPGILRPGGFYQWRVNVRDRVEDREYGDFNHGSLSPFYLFSVQDPS